MFEKIENYKKWRIIEKINKGWSDDIKYYIETEENHKLLLRISDISKYESKEKEYDIICKYSQLGFQMSEPKFWNRSEYFILYWTN